MAKYVCVLVRAPLYKRARRSPLGLHKKIQIWVCVDHVTPKGVNGGLMGLTVGDSLLLGPLSRLSCASHREETVVREGAKEVNPGQSPISGHG